jgi:protoporphyrinogen oxidase
MLSGVEYQGIVCASLLLREPLSPYYVTNITDDWVPFTAVIEMSALVDRAEFGGRALVYLPRYAPGDDPVFDVADDDLRERFLAALARMYPHFRREHVECFQVSRVRHVYALSTIGYSTRLPPIRTSVPGLFAVNSAHIVNGTLNVNETVGLADRAMEELTHGHRG